MLRSLNREANLDKRDGPLASPRNGRNRLHGDSLKAAAGKPDMHNKAPHSPCRWMKKNLPYHRGMPYSGRTSLGGHTQT
jgi:hypothetical protein